MAGSATGRSGFHYAYLIVLSGIVITCVPCALVLSCAGIFFTPVSAFFGVSKATYSLYFSILNVAMMVALPVAGRLMERLDMRLVLSACVVMAGVGLMAFSTFNEMWQFYVVGAVLGLALAPLLYLAVPVLVNAWCVRRVGFFVGLCMAFTGIGGVIFNPVGSALIASGPEGWRRAYLVFGIIILVVTLPFTLFVVRSKPADKGLEPYGTEEVGATGAKAAVRALASGRAMKVPAFYALAAFCGLITLNQTVYQFLPSYVTSLSETSLPALAATAGTVASACMAGQAIGKVALGTLSDRSVIAGLAGGLVAGAAGVLVMMLVPGVPVLLMAGSFMFGFAYACTTVQTPLLTRTVFGERDYTAIYSRISMVGSLFGAVAAVFWGWICDLPNGYAIMFVLSLVCLGSCLALGAFALSQRAALEKDFE
ncbi:MFS transporter [uncultured Parolsenella sp.]|uniref:MFS transporter n=1 Tax=uncultured Parolsenella sp. TaxID=2083008 RepID=UPI0027D988C1|nr:MFS transporter [uncultured Parolsenella sp.]